MVTGELLKLANYGCYLLTTVRKEEVNGMPLSLFMQISSNPALVVIGVAKERYSYQMLKDSKLFAVIFLRADQKNLVKKFKAPGDKAEKFQGLEWGKTQSGLPILKDCLGYIECRVKELIPCPGHDLFIGEVMEEKLIKPGELLTLAHLGESYPA